MEYIVKMKDQDIIDIHKKCGLSPGEILGQIFSMISDDLIVCIEKVLKGDKNE